MIEEFAYKAIDNRWISGFVTRQEAIDAAIEAGLSQVTTSVVTKGSAAYFARFEASTILARMISGLEHGEKSGKLIGSDSAIKALTPILNACPSDHFGTGIEPKEWHLQVDLMNRLEAATESWIIENNLATFEPRFIAYASEELHINGTGINVQLL